MLNFIFMGLQVPLTVNSDMLAVEIYEIIPQSKLLIVQFVPAMQELSSLCFYHRQENCSSADILFYGQYKSVNNALPLAGLPTRVPTQTRTAREYKQCMQYNRPV